MRRRGAYCRAREATSRAADRRGIAYERKDDDVEEDGWRRGRSSSCVVGERRCSRIGRPRTAQASAGSRARSSSGFITKFPVDFYFTLVGGAKTWDKAHTRASASSTRRARRATDDAGEIAAIQDMVAQGVKGIAITPTSPAVIPALDKAVEGGRQGRADGQRPPDLEEEDVGRRDQQPRWAGCSPASGSPTKLKAGDTLGILEGVPGVPALDDRVNGMLAGLGALKAQIKVVSKLETDCDQTKGAAAAQTMLTANPNLTAIYSACGPPALGRDPVDQERGHQAGRDHPRRASTGSRTR